MNNYARGKPSTLKALLACLSLAQNLQLLLQFADRPHFVRHRAAAAATIEPQTAAKGQEGEERPKELLAKEDSWARSLWALEERLAAHHQDVQREAAMHMRASMNSELEKIHLPYFEEAESAWISPLAVRVPMVEDTAGESPIMDLEFEKLRVPYDGMVEAAKVSPLPKDTAAESPIPEDLTSRALGEGAERSEQDTGDDILLENSTAQADIANGSRIHLALAVLISLVTPVALYNYFSSAMKQGRVPASSARVVFRPSQKRLRAPDVEESTGSMLTAAVAAAGGVSALCSMAFVEEAAMAAAAVGQLRKRQRRAAAEGKKA